MANSPQPPIGYSVSITLSHPDTPTPHREITPIAPPFPSPVPSRFPPPKLQQDQIPSPSIKTPNMLSPANGVKTGSPIPHMSTPPAPPVLSSPIRPTAVPFRTSPASPQPVAFSSGSSLPTPSPPYFSNGSAELRHQISDATEDSVTVGDSPFVLFSAHKWVIFRKLNVSEGEYIAPSKEELRNFPELSSPMVDYVQTGNNRPGFIPVSDSRMSAPIVLVIDECLDEPHLHHLQSSLHEFADSLSPTTRIGILLCGRTVSVYDFSEESIASADVLPGDKSPTQDALKALIYGTGIYLSPIHASLPVVRTHHILIIEAVQIEHSRSSKRPVPWYSSGGCSGNNARAISRNVWRDS